MVEFTLGFGCDVPRFLDRGVRFEIQRARQDWEPIRFYSPTLDVNEPSLVHFDDAAQRSVHAQAFAANNTFPLHFINASEGPVGIREYLCGEEYANETVRFRWMQRYVPPSMENVSTWWLDDVRISRWDSSVLSTILENNFSNDNLDRYKLKYASITTVTNSLSLSLSLSLSSNYEIFSILAGVIEPPLCSSSDSALYFRNESTRSIPRRSLVITSISLACNDSDCPPPVPLVRGMCN